MRIARGSTSDSVSAGESPRPLKLWTCPVLVDTSPCAVSSDSQTPTMAAWRDWRVLFATVLATTSCARTICKRHSATRTRFVLARVRGRPPYLGPTCCDSTECEDGSTVVFDEDAEALDRCIPLARDKFELFARHRERAMVQRPHCLSA